MVETGIRAFPTRPEDNGMLRQILRDHRDRGLGPAMARKMVTGGRELGFDIARQHNRRRLEDQGIQRRPELARGLVSRLLPIDALHSAEPIRAGQQLGLSIRVSDVPHVLTHHTSAPLDVPRPMWDDWTRIRLEN